MNGSKVADILEGGKDSTGAEIETVYSKVNGTYAVYRTPARVVVQYADDEKLGSEQRLALSPLNPVRGEINGLIDGWRASTKGDKQAKARLFDRRVADALIVALQGDQQHALELLTRVKEDILEERTSLARSEYLIIAALSALALIIVLGIITAPSFATKFYDFGAPRWLWLAATIGAIGALFSIGLAIRTREILTDLQSRDNAVDAILRVVIGATSAAVLFALLLGELVTFGFGGDSIKILSADGAAATASAVVVAFAAGFSERLVGNFLSRSTLSAAIAANPLAGGTPTRPAGPSGPSPEANERNPLGKHAPVVSPSVTPLTEDTAIGLREEDDADCCVADIAIADDELTADVELPEASGGVERPTV